MTAGRPITYGLIEDILDALDRHGFTRSDDQHTGRAIGLIGDLARIYEGSQHHLYGPSVTPAPSSAPLAPPGPDPGYEPSIPEDDLDAVTLTHAEVRTVLTSLDLAADWKRDRAEMCADCTDQSCYSCELRLKEARTYDRLAVQLLHDEQAARSHPGLAGPPLQPQPASERQAGQ